MNFRKLGFILLISCAVFPNDKLFSASLEDDIGPKQFARIRSDLAENATIANSSRGKNITVFLGQTGAGKSTMINFICDIPMEVYDGALQPKGGCAIDSGFNSCTKFPKHMLSPKLGDIYDLPGFQDSNGAVDDILNACFIRRILSEAQAVRVIVLTKWTEIDAKRGEAFKNLAYATRMFDDAFRCRCCMLAVNATDRDDIPKMKERLLRTVDESLRVRADSDLSYFKELIQRDTFHCLPRFRDSDGADFIASTREGFIDKIRRLVPQKVTSLNMSPTLKSETAHSIEGFLFIVMRDLLADMKQRATFIEKAKKEFVQKGHRSPSELLRAQRDEIWRYFVDTVVKKSEFYELLAPVCIEQCCRMIEKFEPYFDKEHLADIQILRIDEEAQAKKEAEEKKIEAEKMAKQKEEEADIARNKAQQSEQDRIAAEAEAQKRAEEAEEARNNEKLTAAERDEARHVAQEAALRATQIEQQAAEDRKQLLEKQKEAENSMKELRQAAEEAKERSSQLEKTYMERLQAMEAEARRREDRAERERAAMQQEVERLKKEGDERANQVERQLKEAQEKHAQETKDMSQRQEREKKSWTAARSERQQYAIVSIGGQYYLIGL